MNMKKTGLMALLLFSMINPSIADNGSGSGEELFPRLSAIQPIEPTTASLGRYGEYQMDYSNGMPDISIPLYEIKSGDLTIPIVLRYQGGGIKVQQEATWVGLGWDLFYGGQLTRVVQGFPDEAELSKDQRPTAASVTEYIQANDNLTESLYLNNLARASSSDISFMPDDYYYNVGMENGKFIGKDVEALIPHKPIKIINGGKFGVKWQISNATGDCYYFNEIETTAPLNAEHTFSPYPSAWYIDRIVSVGNHSIRYVYQNDGVYSSDNACHYEGFSYRECIGSGGNSSDYCSPGLTPISLNKKSISMKVTSKKPEYIYFDGGRLVFTLSARNDIMATNNAPLQKLDRITLEYLSSSNTYIPIKSFVFDYYYMNNNQTVKYKRLMLNKVDEFSHESGTFRNIAQFNYNTTSLPAKDSFNYDYCGYYNGTTNVSPIPLYQRDTPYGVHTGGGANKNVIESYTKAGVLTTVHYPTKGKTDFIWENHRYRAEQPLYNGQYTTAQNIDVNISCPTFNHATPPSPFDDEVSCSGQSFTFFTNYLYQKVHLTGSIIRKANSHSHNKYDQGSLQVSPGWSKSFGINSPDILYIDEYIYLAANTSYTVSANVNCSNLEAELHFSYNAYDPLTDKYNYPYGGLRIKEIANYDMDGSPLDKTAFSYVNPNDTTKSGGYITNTASILLEKNLQNVESIFVLCGESNPMGQGICCFQIWTHASLFYDNPLSGIYPNNLSYQYIQVQKIDPLNNTQNGITKYEFKKAFDTQNDYDMPIVSASSERGQIVKESVYNQSNQLLKETRNYYSNHTSINQSAHGFKLYCILSGNTCFPGEIPLSNRFVPTDYSVNSVWCKLDSTIQESYFDSNIVKNKTDYIYNDTLSCQPTQITILLNNSKNKITTFQYPFQLTDAASLKMKEKNMVGQFVTKEEKINTTVLSKQTNKYSIKAITPTMGSYENSELIYLDSIRVKYGASNEETELKMKYDLRNNIREYNTRSNTPVTYLWGYNNQYPIAAIQNATYDQVKAALSQGETLINRVANAYIPTNEDLVAINNLRTSNTLPTNAQITTYTYKPLIGVETLTDPRGVKVTYRYDAFCRLQWIEDKDGKKVESYDYHYKNQ
ncbi:hypothetical protein FACS1894176_03130 [Bacteroidia bacterium]|nr:hypothetical protein FACS1894176_03130 [Bacteroidia bacterium]